MSDSKYVYESPDGGRTVYRREFGSTQRELFDLSQEARAWMDLRARKELWEHIVTLGSTDPGINEMLKQIEVYYHLKYDEKS